VKHAHDVAAVAFAPSGKHFLTGSRDKSAVVWTLKGEKVTTVQHGDVFGVYAVAFAPSGEHFLTGSDENSAVVWTLGGKKVTTVKHAPSSEHFSVVHAVAFAPSGEHFLTGATDKSARLWCAPPKCRSTTPRGLGTVPMNAEGILGA